MLKYIISLAILLPIPAFAQSRYYRGECIKVVEDYVAGHYNRYGYWVPGYRRIREVPSVCPYSPVPDYIPGYTPLPAPRYIEPVCGRSTINILGIPIIGTTVDCQ